MPGGGGDPAQIQQLAQFLIEQGITPQELEQAIAASPAGGGMEVPASDRVHAKLDALLTRLAPPKQAAAKVGHAQGEMASFLNELLSRSRRTRA